MADELMWRRNWKPDFETQPWKVITADKETYLLKCFFDESLCSYKIAISDYEKIWSEEMCESSFSDRAKKLNPNVEARNTYLLKHLLDSLSQTSLQNNFSLKQLEAANKQVTLSHQSKLPVGVPFIWEFYCSLEENHMMKENLVFPLLSILGELQRRQRELVKIIKKKDYEIQEYKNSGAVLPRKAFETPTFDQDAFAKKMTVSEEFLRVVENCAVNAFHEDSQELYKQVMIKRQWLDFRNSPHLEEDGASGTVPDSFASDNFPGPSASGAPASSWDAKLPPSLADEAESSPVKRTPVSSPSKSPNTLSSPEKSPSKGEELRRREDLRKRLADEAEKKKTKKKRKLKI